MLSFSLKTDGSFRKVLGGEISRYFCYTKVNYKGGLQAQ